MSNGKKINELIQQNNDLRLKLTAENENYYSDLLIYLRTAGLFYNEEDIELRLMEILQDILEAQAAGISAQRYFGGEPQVIADQLISNFPEAGFQAKMKTFALIFGISSLFSFINQLNPNSNQLNLLPFLLNGVLTLVSIKGIFWLMHSGIYSKQSDNKVRTNLIVAALAILFFSLSIGIQFLKPDVLSFHIPNHILVAFSFALPILFTALTFFGKEKWSSLLLSILPFFWTINSVYVFQKYNIIDFQSNRIARYGLGIALLLSFFWSQFALFLEDKKHL